MTDDPVSLTLEEERSLIAAAVAGDAEAFGVLYQHHLDPIYRYVYFRVSTQEEAEDLTEDVFVRAWEALGNYTAGEHSIRAWLYRIAHNLVVDHHRRPGMEPMPDSEHREPAAPGDSVEDTIELSGDLDALKAAMRYLDSEEHTVIMLRFVEGLSHSEIAAAIGKSEGASRVIQHRAIQALRSHLNRSDRS